MRASERAPTHPHPPARALTHAYAHPRIYIYGNIYVCIHIYIDGLLERGNSAAVYHAQVLYVCINVHSHTGTHTYTQTQNAHKQTHT